MGMGYGANFADTVKQDFIQEKCPKEFSDFILSLEESDDVDLSLAEFANDYPYGDIQNEVMQEKFQLLINKFKEKTGLELNILHHNSKDDGDRYDEANGVIWVVENAYKMTEAGEKNKDKISRKFWVNFG